MGIRRDIGPVLIIPSRLHAVATETLLQRVVHCKSRGRVDERQSVSLDEECGRGAWECPMETESK